MRKGFCSRTITVGLGVPDVNSFLIRFLNFLLINVVSGTNALVLRVKYGTLEIASLSSMIYVCGIVCKLILSTLETFSIGQCLFPL